MNALGIIAVALAALAAEVAVPFHASRQSVPDALAKRMRQQSWHEGCPTPIADLAYLRLSYVGIDRRSHTGEMVVHRELAAEVIAIFKALYEQRFPIEKMRLIDDYGGDDDASMADNNTSGFNCRFVPGKPGVFSQHSRGRAIDINPRMNPMIAAGGVLPPAGAPFVDRTVPTPGLLRSGDQAVRAFSSRGWTWGGSWDSLKDYQHFEK